MDEEQIRLGWKEQKTALVLYQLGAGLLSVEAAAAVLGRSVRQVYRLQAAVAGDRLWPCRRR